MAAAAAAATASTCTLSTPSTTLPADGTRPHSLRVFPRCVSLPTLAPPAPLHFAPQKAIAYCYRMVRNVASMATGESMTTTESTTEVTTDPTAEVANGTPEISEETPDISTLNAVEKIEVTTEQLEILKTIQDVWDKVEDKYAVSSLVAAGGLALVATAGMISAIDRLPLVPGVLELVGIGYTGWFAYRNLISKLSRDALIEKIKCTYADIIG